MTKTKWNREVTAKQLYHNCDSPLENLPGWLPILPSRDIGVNQIKATHVFGNDLMVFRSMSGVIHVLDAYCPHMGTYLPIGGKVHGNGVRCPFHGWTINGDGACAHVPGQGGIRALFPSGTVVQFFIFCSSKPTQAQNLD